MISAGAVAGLMTVVMTLMIGATRVVFAMSRDWLLPRRLARTSPRTGTPVRITLIIGAVVALIASLTPIGKLEEMVNIGTLAAFTLVSIAVPILRKRRPDLKRSFKVPFNPYLPILAAVVCVYLMLNLSRGDLDPVRHLDAAGLHHLLRLQPLPQPVGRRRGGCRPAGRRAGVPHLTLAPRRTTTPRCPPRAAGCRRTTGVLRGS